MVTLRHTSPPYSTEVLAFCPCFGLPIEVVLSKSSAWACIKWSKLLITGRRMYRTPQGYMLTYRQQKTSRNVKMIIERD